MRKHIMTVIIKVGTPNPMPQPSAILLSRDKPFLASSAAGDVVVELVGAGEDVAVELAGAAASSGISVDGLGTSTTLEAVRIDVSSVENTKGGKRTRRPSELRLISLPEPQHVVLSALQQNPPPSHCVTCRARLLGLPKAQT